MRFDSRDPYYIAAILNRLEVRLPFYHLGEAEYHTARLSAESFEIHMEGLE